MADPSHLNVTNKTGYLASQMKDTFKRLSFSRTTDIVMVCGDNNKVFLHKAIMVTLSTMLREVLDPESRSTEEVMLEQDSSIVRKMVELIYTGKSNVNRKEKKSLKYLLRSLGISLKLDIVKKRDYCEKYSRKVTDVLKNIEPMEVTDVLKNIEPVEVTDVLKNIEPVEVTDVLKNIEPVEVSDVLKNIEPVENSDIVDQNDVSQMIEATNVSTSPYFTCPLCEEVVRFKVRLIKHMVDDHYYEELETLLVGDFCQSTVCCEMDFAKSGFGQFIRHKAEKHRAVQEVATRKVRECLDRGKVEKLVVFKVFAKGEVLRKNDLDESENKFVVDGMINENGVLHESDVDMDNDNSEGPVHIENVVEDCWQDARKQNPLKQHQTHVVPVPYGQISLDQPHVLLSYCRKISSSAITNREQLFFLLWNRFMLSYGQGVGFLHLPFLLDKFVEKFGLAIARKKLCKQFLQHLVILEQNFGQNIGINKLMINLFRMNSGVDMWDC